MGFPAGNLWRENPEKACTLVLSFLAAPVDMVAAEFQRRVRLLRTDAADQGGGGWQVSDLEEYLGRFGRV